MDILQNAINNFSNNNYTNLRASSRTDKGVHAIRNTIQVDLKDRQHKSRNIDNSINKSLESIKNGINFYLKHDQYRDIQIKDIAIVENDFDVRRQAIARTYMYRLLVPVSSRADNPVHDLNDHIKEDRYHQQEWYHHDDLSSQCYDSFPLFQREFAWIYDEYIDIEKVIQSSKELLGTHDFSSFKCSNCQQKQTVKTIYEINIQKSSSNSSSRTIHGSNVSQVNEDDSFTPHET